jgi:cellulose biosynthesis protein BcsQ
MAQIIAMFNHKDGVSKTTCTFHLGWMLAEKGTPVLLVDADPQCNLSGLIMDFGGLDRLEQLYIDDPQRNIMAGLPPAFESKPQLIEAMDPVSVEGCRNLYLMPGHLRLSEYKTTLSMAHEFSTSLLPLKNVPGSIYHLFEATAAKIDAEIVVVDMNPSLSAINLNILMTANYFIIPTSPDYFSVMALNSLAAVLPRWAQWYRIALTNPVLKDSVYKPAFPR